MTFSTTIQPERNRYTVSIVPGDLTSDEQTAFSRFGEPGILLGGSFTTSGGSPVTFTLPSSSMPYPTGFPVKQSFDIGTDSISLANAKAVAWRDAIVANIKAGRDTQVALSAGVVGTEVITYPAIS